MGQDGENDGWSEQREERVDSMIIYTFLSLALFKGSERKCCCLNYSHFSRSSLSLKLWEGKQECDTRDAWTPCNSLPRCGNRLCCFPALPMASIPHYLTLLGKRGKKNRSFVYSCRWPSRHLLVQTPLRALWFSMPRFGP